MSNCVEDKPKIEVTYTSEKRITVCTVFIPLESSYGTDYSNDYGV